MLVHSVILLALSACNGTAQTTGETPNSIDSKGLVEFHLPAGWIRLASSQSSRFVPEGADRENAMLGVIPDERYPGIDIETFWQNTMAKHEFQGQVRVRESSSRVNGFDVREAVYEAERNGQAVVYHDYYLFTDALQIDLHLNATKQAHQRYEKDLETVALSIRPTAGGD
jgi:hypothetical protein